MTTSADPGKPPFDAVLCDIDGVIRFFDHRGIALLEHAAGLPEGGAAQAAFGPGIAEQLVLGALTREQWAQAIAGRLRGDGVPAGPAAELATAFTRVPARADAAVVDLLRRARQRCTVLLVSNATVWLDEDLAALGLAGLADGVVNSARVGAAKPDPRIYRFAADQARVSPGRCLFVDDRPENVEAARRLGMTGLLYREPADLHRALGPLLDPAPTADPL
ncbi:HAD-IA family hydrolase [Kitasatospora sp. RG8]|uniref:HAD-IA family hydrolase n=1 Tax=Kitasatospora sp. RG8 TaxID=2820815 RepID=UPI001ADFFA56|nr:HAD-IA family hydrolase [Kitasatospora sp. RG8]MBP0454250.1 HAD-IA family hydrolase [Kitasatospora sp. RG8]